MAKQIKVIQCPQCASTDKIEIKPDFYRCKNCQTEYFLDNDDVTINYNHTFKQASAFGDEATKKAIKVVAIIFAVIMFVIILLNILIGIFSSNNKSTNEAYTAAEARIEETGFSASRYNSQFFHRGTNELPLLLTLESRRYKADKDEQLNGLYLVLFDTMAKKELAAHKLEKDTYTGSNLSIRKFNDGNTYVITDKSAIYLLDNHSLKLVDIGKKFFAAKQELEVGVATMEFVYSDNGDGLVLLTNDGKKFYYYPLVEKLYKENQYYEARRGFNNLLPGAKDKTFHTFTKQSTDYPDDKLMLLKIKYKDNGSGPKDVPDHISWRKDYGGSGIFTDRDPYRKVLFDNYMKNTERIMDWKDLTPERLYFSPTVLFDEGAELIICFKASAAPASAYKMQKINTTTGNPEWTADLPDEIRIREMVKYKDGYIGIADNDTLFFYDSKGVQKQTYKFE